MSSTVSCRTAAAIVASSSLRSVRIAATSSGMAEEQVAGRALLIAVRHHGVDIGPVEQRLVGQGVVAPDPLDKFVLAHHPACRLLLQIRSNRLKLKDIVELLPRRKACMSSAPPRATKKPGLGPGFRRIQRGGRDHSRSSSSALLLGGTSPSRPRRRSSSLMRSNWTSASLSPAGAAAAVLPRSGTVSASGSSTSTYFCSEWISCSFRSSGAIVSSAISRSATTGFLSRSRSMVSGEPGGDQAGAMAREQDELEPVLDLVDAIFDGHTSHERLLLKVLQDRGGGSLHWMGRENKGCRRTLPDVPQAATAMRRHARPTP